MSGSDNGLPRTTFYRICRWNELYENAQSRPLKYLRWVAMPILIGTPEYAELLDHQDGPAHFGLWIAIIHLGAQCQPRGSLLKEGGVPHNQNSIALYSRMPSDVCRIALERYRELNWLEVLPYQLSETPTTYQPTEDRRNPLDSHQNAKGKIQTSTNNARARYRTEQNNRTPPLPPSSEGGVGSRRLTKKERHAEEFAAEQQRRLKQNA